MDISLKGKNALVCGSTQGIGFAIANELANLGANIVLLARNRDKMENIVKILPNSGKQNHNIIVADFADYLHVKECVDEYLQNHPPFHILINNTGGPPSGPITDAKIDEFFKAYGMHLAINHLLMQSLLPGMKQEEYGRIINIISTSVKQPIDGLGVSNTTRGAVGNWAKTLANEVTKYGITVNNILPGSTDTQRIRSIIQTRAQKLGKSQEEIEKAMINAIPMGRFGKPSEIANVVAFLCSPAASYVSGINLPVDGGRTKSL